MQPDGSIYSGNSIIWQQGPILTISFLRNQLEIYHLIYCTLVYSLKKFTNQQQVNFHVNIILHATNSTQLTPVSKIIKMFNASATDVFTQRHFLTSASIISSRVKHIPATWSDRWVAGFTCQVLFYSPPCWVPQYNTVFHLSKLGNYFKICNSVQQQCEDSLIFFVICESWWRVFGLFQRSRRHSSGKLWGAIL